MSVEDKLEDLRRKIDAGDADRHVRRDYLSALIRTGQGERAKQLMLEGFLCPMNWEDLEKTEDLSVRSCQECHSEVFVCHTTLDVRLRAERGECVVAPTGAMIEYADQLIRGTGGAHPQTAPCLNAIEDSELLEIDLMQLKPNEYLMGAAPPMFPLPPISPDEHP